MEPVGRPRRTSRSPSWALALVLLPLLCSVKAQTVPLPTRAEASEYDYPVADPELCSGFADLLHWVNSQGGLVSDIEVNLTRRDDGRELRTVVASSDLRPGVTVVSVPPNITMSLVTAMQHSAAFQRVFRRSADCGCAPAPALLPQKALFTLFLLHEALNASSFWRPHICTLPRFVDLPMSWPDAKFLGMEDPLSPESRLFDHGEKRHIMQDSIDSRDFMWKHYAAAYEHIVWKNQDLFPPHKYTPEGWRWAWSIMQTRTWGEAPPDWMKDVVSDPHKDTHVMVPLADMFNHRRDAAHVDVDQEEGTWDVFVGWGARAGEEIFVNYGEGFGNLDLLLTFGFTDPSLEEQRGDACAATKIPRAAAGVGPGGV